MTFTEMLVLIRKARLGTSGRKLVMMVLAEHCGTDANGDWSCFPSQTTIAEQVELSDRQVRTILADFEREGLIERQKRARLGARGGRSSDRITLVLPALDALTQPEVSAANPHGPNRKSATTQPEVCDDPTGSLASGEVPVKNQEDPLSPPKGGRSVRIDSTLSDPDFVAFYAAYPSARSRRDAARAWPAALKRAGMASVLIDAANELAEAAGPNLTDLAAPSVWLNQDRWADDQAVHARPSWRGLPPTPREPTAGMVTVDRPVATVCATCDDTRLVIPDGTNDAVPCPDCVVD